MDGIGVVMKKFADLPRVIEPTSCCSSNAQAVLIVAALIASAGVIFILMHASEIISGIFPDGELPGL